MMTVEADHEQEDSRRYIEHQLYNIYTYEYCYLNKETFRIINQDWHWNGMTSSYGSLNEIEAPTPAASHLKRSNYFPF